MSNFKNLQSHLVHYQVGPIKGLQMRTRWSAQVHISNEKVW